VRLTDEKDLFFLYTLRLGEEDFQRYVAVLQHIYVHVLYRMTNLLSMFIKILFEAVNICQSDSIQIMAS